MKSDPIEDKLSPDDSRFLRVSCDGKEAFTEMRYAELAVGRRKHRQVYRCIFCHCWHIGTKPPKSSALLKHRELPYGTDNEFDE